MWQVGVLEWVHEEPCDAFEDEIEVLLAVYPGQIVEEEVVIS